MKKIMFNDKYGLTKAVLEGRKIQTRRIVKDVNLIQYLNELEEDGALKGIRGKITAEENALYEVDEVVAIAQRYSDIEIFLPFDRKFDIERGGKERAGWNNKMFVEATYMPHHIRITNVRVERLQDCSDDDCIAEGITYVPAKYDFAHPFDTYTFDGMDCSSTYYEAKEAYADLIDKVSGKGTWDANPYVFVYDFELIS